MVLFESCVIQPYAWQGITGHKEISAKGSVAVNYSHWNMWPRRQRSPDVKIHTFLVLGGHNKSRYLSESLDGISLAKIFF
jgi:hypothetical protein